MKLFTLILTEGQYMPSILKKISEKGYHGSVLPTMSTKNALLTSEIDQGPIFGGFSKVVNYSQSSRPMLYIVVKNDDEIKELFHLVKEAVGGNLTNKGFMFVTPVEMVEGI